ncbi:hypothetical protein, partial [Salmonella sp. s51228]|uniref:hypothetical protein n=1 Tax=Salmonella sp. s51228 TaxID=3159652 RepID=UPI00398169B8
MLKENNYAFNNYTLSCYNSSILQGTIYINIIDARRIHISYSSPPHFAVLTSSNNTAPYEIPPLAQNIRLSCVMEGCGWGTSSAKPVNPYYNISVMNINENTAMTSYFKYLTSATDTTADLYPLLQMTIITSGSSFAIEHSTRHYSILPSYSILTVTSDVTLACATDKTTNVADSYQWYYTSLDNSIKDSQLTNTSFLNTSTGISTL